MNTNNTLKISTFCVMRLTRNLNFDKLNIVVWSWFKGLLCGIHCFTVSMGDSLSRFNDGVN